MVARLDQLLSRELRQLVIDAHSIIVPAADEPRFLADFVPGLRRRIALTSSDALGAAARRRCHPWWP